MAYLLGRNHDVFISYAHADDEVSHWVKDFGVHLKKELSRQLRIKENRIEAVDVTVWKDNQLSQQGNLSKRLEVEIKESSIFLVIMSKSYLLSEWCKREGITFVNSLKDKSELRVFIIEKEETARNEWPEFLKTEEGDPLLSKPFSEEVDVGQTETIPMKTPQGAADPRADRIMREFCNDLSDQLHSLKNFPEFDVPGQTRRVFLALSPEGEVRKRRAKLAALLRGWKDISILPSPEPRSKEEFEESLEKQLPQCHLFLQVLDDSQGLYLSDSPTGFVGHQFDAAVKKEKKILHWMDPDLRLDSLEDGPYTELLRTLRLEQDGGTVVSGSLENFAQRVHDVLHEVEVPGKSAVVSKGTCFVAVKSDFQDQKCAKDVGGAITRVKSDIPVMALYPTPQFRAEELDTLMALSKGVVIVWGNVSWDWVLREVERLNEVVRQGVKVGVVAVCDPYPKSIEFESREHIWPMNLSSVTDPAKREAAVVKYVAELQRVILAGEHSH